MKLKTSALLATVAIAIAIPASAQRIPVGGSSSNKKAPDDAKPQALPQGIPGEEGPKSTTGRKLEVTKKAQKAIIELQDAVRANDQASVPAKLAAAQAVASTADEKFIVASLQTQAALAANNLAGIEAGIAALQASGSADLADIGARYADLGKRYAKAGQTDAAIAAYNKAIAADASNAAALALLADAYNKTGKKAEAVDLMQKSFAASRAKNEKIAEGNYMFATGLAYDLRSPVANTLARDWVRAYPSAKSWRDSLRIYRDLAKPRGTQLLDLMRLARAANALSGESDYHSYLTSLADAGALAEAKTVLNEASKAEGVDVTKDAFKQVATRLAKAHTRAAIDAQAKTALAGGDAAAMISAGDELYGVGAYSEAAALYRAAVAKGGDSGLANLHLGMALARAGDAAAAKTALEAVTGANKPIADYWLLWLATRG